MKRTFFGSNYLARFFFAFNIYFVLKLVVFSQNYLLAFGQENERLRKKVSTVIDDVRQRTKGFMVIFFVKKYVTKTCENAHNIS